MNMAKVITLLGALMMAGAIAYALIAGDFAAEGGIITGMPWGIVSLIDLYVGFILFAGWILYRDGPAPMTFFWIGALLVLGFFAGSLYAFIALQRSGGEWRRFWLGQQA